MSNSTIYNPTNYGPVDVYTTAGTTAIDSQTQGTISKLVAQPNNEAYPAVDSNGNWKYVEIYKGPTSVVKDMPNDYFWPGRRRTLARTAFGTSRFVDRFSAPDCPTNKDWYVDSCVVRQNTAGDTSEIRITYTAKGFSASGGWTENTKLNTWTLQWQPYTVSPYAFCVNDMKNDKTPEESPQDSDCASRSNIEQFFKQPKIDLSGYTYLDENNTTRVLNKAEQLVAKKVFTNTNCMWHHPIVTYTSTKEHEISADIIDNPTYPDELGGVDYIPDDLDMPFSFSKNYQWVKIDDSIETTKTTGICQMKRHQSWMGVISADENYYGDGTFDHSNLEECRWNIGEV